MISPDYLHRLLDHSPHFSQISPSPAVYGRLMFSDKHTAMQNMSGNKIRVTKKLLSFLFLNHPTN